MCIRDSIYTHIRVHTHLYTDIQHPRAPQLYDTLCDLGYDERQFHDAIPTMASEALASGSPSYNPVQADQGQIETLYAEMYAEGKEAAKAKAAA